MTTKLLTMPRPEEALPGREDRMIVSLKHVVNGNPTLPPFPENMQTAMFGSLLKIPKKTVEHDIYSGTEVTSSLILKLWSDTTYRPRWFYSVACLSLHCPPIHVEKSAVICGEQAGYSSGFTCNPTYEEVCTGRTGQAEVVRVIYDPEIISYSDLLKLFWENHDPTKVNRQGRSQGTQDRSGIYYYTSEQKALAEESKKRYVALLQGEGHGEVITEIKPVSEFYYAEDYHQQYLYKNPDGLKGTGVLCS